MKHIIRCYFAFLCLISFAQPSLAAPSAEVTKGLAWLQSQVQGDGSLSGEAASVASSYQSRNETLHILKLLATVPAPLFAAIAADTEDSTEYLSRRIVSTSLMGGSTSSLIAQLNALQNPDGGFGGGVDYTSHALDTAWALTAYAKAGLSNSSAALNARNYLASIVQLDGGMTGSTDVERVVNSAMSASALQMVPASTGSLTAINQLVAWLLQKQAVDGSWNQDVSLTALALLAVNSIATDPTLHATVQNYLLGQQGSDGSWSADPYVTAVVLRALSAEPGSAPSLLGTVIGVILDQASGVPLQGATITLTGAGNGTAQSAQDGRF
ncbi:MAG: terpene cyclase/mutase family protein, partial [Burkholderiales bacterium]|nr:terpene cyclase/mutase family protein [Burkholderiales bacterium]